MIKLEVITDNQELDLCYGWSSPPGYSAPARLEINYWGGGGRGRNRIGQRALKGGEGLIVRISYNFLLLFLLVFIKLAHTGIDENISRYMMRGVRSKRSLAPP